MLIRRIVLVAIGSVALWGCGSDDDADIAAVSSVVADSLPASSESDDGDAEEADVEADVEAEIVISDFAFTGDQEVPVGGRVVVTNTDAASHTWTAVDGSFDSGTLAEGESFEFTFDEPGRFAYVCSIHPTMGGSVTVTG